MARTIQLAPKWRDVVVWIMNVLEDPKAPERAKKPLREELLRLAREMDFINAGAKARSMFNRRRR
jgi:hypothetical protein